MDSSGTPPEASPPGAACSAAGSLVLRVSRSQRNASALPPFLGLFQGYFRAIWGYLGLFRAISGLFQGYFRAIYGYLGVTSVAALCSLHDIFRSICTVRAARRIRAPSKGVSPDPTDPGTDESTTSMNWMGVRVLETGLFYGYFRAIFGLF